MNLKAVEKAFENAEYFSGVIQIIEKGEILLTAAKGYAKREDELLNGPDTAFGIASGTKGFTALGVLRLIDRGKLSLEDQVFDMLPYEFPNMDKSVTVRHLLSHTSGIYDYFDEEVIEDFGRLFEKVPVHKILGPKDMLPLLIEGQAHFKPGEKFKYCNSGFVILGMLIEVVSGMSYGGYIEKEVCKPLNQTRTGCFRSNRLPKNSACGYIKDDHGNWYSNIFEIPIACTADGGLFTTAGDIAEMWKGVVSGGFLSKGLSEEVFSIQADAGGRENHHYGLGFWIQTDKAGNISDYYLVGGDPGVSFGSYYNICGDRIVTILGNVSECTGLLRKEISPYLD